MRAANIIPFQIAVTVQSVNAGRLHDFIKESTNKSVSFIDGASNTAEDASEQTLSALSSFEDEVKAPLCVISKCVNPITFQFQCHCSVIAESFKVVPDAGTAVNSLGLSQQFVYDLLECCPEIGTTDTQFLKCMIGCDGQEESDEAVSESTLCKIANCEIPQALGFSNDNIEAVTTSCCPGGEPLGTFSTCFDAMKDSGLVDTEKWRNVQLDGTSQADIFCSDGSGVESVMGTSSARDQVLSPAVLIVAFAICHVHGHHLT